MKTNATQRSLKELRKRGYSVCIVEKYIKFPGMPFGKRIDAFGIADLLACRAEPPEIALVQTFPNSGGSGFAQHTAKILAIPELSVWKAAGGKVLLMGWAKQGPRGKRKTWTLREEAL